MARRSSSLNNTDSGISREIGTQYANVKIVADNIDAVTKAASVDLEELARVLEEATDFEGITVVSGEVASWNPETKVLTVPTVKGDKGDKGSDLSIVEVEYLSGGAFKWTFSDGTIYITPNLKGSKGDKGDKGDKGNALTVTSINALEDGSFIWVFSDGTQYVTPVLKGNKGDKGDRGEKGDTGESLSITDIIYNGQGRFTYKFSDGTNYVTPDLRGPQGDRGVPGIKGDTGVSVHHLRVTNTTQPNGVLGVFGELDTYTFYGDADETIMLGHFQVRNGVGPDQAEGLGLMFRSTYDTNGSGVVDDSELLQGKDIETIILEDVNPVIEAALETISSVHIVQNEAELLVLTPDLKAEDTVYVVDYNSKGWKLFVVVDTIPTVEFSEVAGQSLVDFVAPLTTLNTVSSTLSSAINELLDKIQLLEATSLSHTSAISTINSRIDAIDGNLIDVVSSIDSLEDRVADNEDNIAQHTEDLQTVQSTLVDLENDKYSKYGGTISGNVAITGDLYVSGETSTVATQELEVSDNVITVNKGEQGPGVTKGTAGIVVDRGTEDNYHFEFNEDSETFRIGEAGSTQAVATREDTPLSSGIAVWDASTNMFITSTLANIISHAGLIKVPEILWTGNTTQYIRGDGTYATLPTYSTNTSAQLIAGTDTTGKLQTALSLNAWLNSKNFLTSESDPTVPAWAKTTGPSAVRFPRINADNSLTWLPASSLRNDLGLTTAATTNLQSSAYDSTPGRILITGAGGLLGSAVQVNFANNLVRGQFIFGNNGPLALENVWGVTSTDSTGSASTTFVGRGDRFFAKGRVGGVDYPWRELYTSGNLLNIGTTSASARSALQLGTAATANVTTSVTDTTAGRVPTVGWMGLGGNAISVSDINSLTVSGFYYCAGGSIGSPVNIAGCVDHREISGGYAIQYYFCYGASIAADVNRVFIRHKDTGVWEAWHELRHSGNQLDIGTTVGSARTALQLGTGATATVTTNILDTTSGRLLRVEDFGLGKGRHLPSLDLSDALAWYPSGMYTINSTSANAPFTYGGIWNLAYSATSAVKLAVATSGFNFWFSSSQNTDWAEVLHSKNSLKLGTTPASARSALELGTAAQLNAQTNTVDTTANRLMRTGAGGIMGTTELITDADDPSLRGSLLRVSTNATSLGVIGHLINITRDGSHSGQLLISETGRLFTRTKNTGAWQSWTEYLSTIGTAASASVLATARTINGTSFNGSANITTSNWGTARNITVGGTSKSVNGSSNIAWTVDEILPTATNGQVLKHNGTSWVAQADANTSYSSMSASEANTGTATSARVITAAVLKGAIQTHAPVQTSISGNAGTATKLQTARTLSWAGDATGSLNFDGSANASTALTLANSGVTAGNYGSSIAVPTVTVDAKGRLTAVSNTTIRSATTGQTGVVQLSTATNSTSTTLAATASAVKTAYDLANGKQNALGYTPVQQGTGVGQTGNVVKIGWSSGSKLKATVDSTDLGNIAFESFTQNASNLTSGTLPAARLSGTYNITITGNAGTATKLAASRTINGTGFDGSANITTASWGTSRNITIGSTAKSVNGGSNVSWSLAEIGASPSNHSHNGTAIYPSVIEVGVAGGTPAYIDFHSRTGTKGDFDARIISVGGTSSNGNAVLNIEAAQVQVSGSMSFHSDKELKTDILPIENALNSIKYIGGDLFTWKSSGLEDAGVIAQKVEKVFPRAVTKGTSGYLTVGLLPMVGLLSKAVVELEDKTSNETAILQDKVSCLESRIAELENLIKEIVKDVTK